MLHNRRTGCIDGERKVRASLRRGEQHFAPVSRPADTLLTPELTGEGLDFAALREQLQPSAVVTYSRMLHERHLSAIGRHARIAQVSRHPVPNLADGVLE